MPAFPIKSTWQRRRVGEPVARAATLAHSLTMERRGPLHDMGWARICACARGWNTTAKLERLREEETQFPLKRKPLRRRRRPPSRLGRIRRIVDRSSHACLRGATIHLDQAPQAPQIQAHRARNPGKQLKIRAGPKSSLRELFRICRKFSATFTAHMHVL